MSRGRGTHVLVLCAPLLFAACEGDDVDDRVDAPDASVSERPEPEPEPQPEPEARLP